jgi:hypothetical protein
MSVLVSVWFMLIGNAPCYLESIAHAPFLHLVCVSRVLHAESVSSVPGTEFCLLSGQSLVGIRI